VWVKSAQFVCSFSQRLLSVHTLEKSSGVQSVKVGPSLPIQGVHLSLVLFQDDPPPQLHCGCQLATLDGEISGKDDKFLQQK